MLLQMGRLLHLGPKVITDGTFITLGSIYYTCAFYKGLEGLKPLSQLQTKNETYQWKMINGKKIYFERNNFFLPPQTNICKLSLRNILITDIDEALACMATVFVQFYYELSGISARDMQGHR